jgi:hypothetical protein
MAVLRCEFHQLISPSATIVLEEDIPRQRTGAKTPPAEPNAKFGAW